MADNSKVTGWVGWILFAGVVLMVRGFAEALFGLGTLLNNQFLLVTANHVAVVNVTAWGWVHLVAGLVMVAAGFSVVNGHSFGRIVAVVLTSLALLVNMTYVAAYPVWSLLLIAIDVLVLYALVVHGNEAANQ